jgi:hypothetical protein
MYIEGTSGSKLRIKFEVNIALPVNFFLKESDELGALGNNYLG